MTESGSGSNWKCGEETFNCKEQGLTQTDPEKRREQLRDKCRDQMGIQRQKRNIACLPENWTASVDLRRVWVVHLPVFLSPAISVCLVLCVVQATCCFSVFSSSPHIISAFTWLSCLLQLKFQMTFKLLWLSSTHSYPLCFRLNTEEWKSCLMHFSSSFAPWALEF